MVLNPPDSTPFPDSHEEERRSRAPRRARRLHDPPRGITSPSWGDLNPLGHQPPGATLGPPNVREQPQMRPRPKRPKCTISRQNHEQPQTAANPRNGRLIRRAGFESQAAHVEHAAAVGGPYDSEDVLLQTFRTGEVSPGRPRQPDPAPVGREQEPDAGCPGSRGSSQARGPLGAGKTSALRAASGVQVGSPR